MPNMRTNKYYIQNELYYSVVYGRGIYEWNGQMVQNPLSSGQGEEDASPLLTNIMTKETFFLKRFTVSDPAHYRRQILAPPGSEHILWPRDMVRLEKEQRATCTLFVDKEYTAMPRTAAERGDQDALLFACDGYPQMVNGLRKLSHINAPSWKVQEVREMAVELVRALDSVNRGGYYYTDIHLSRMYFADSGQAYLDFSNLIFSFLEFAETVENCRVKAGQYPIEFAEPALVREITPYADIHSQNYSLCALLFYLFIGRYPYDGRLLTGSADETLQQHYIKFRDYHKMPIFVFDPETDENSLGAFWEEQQVIELWKELPDNLRWMFTQTLQQENAERKKQVSNPTPGMWLSRFQELGWIKENRKD